MSYVQIEVDGGYITRAMSISRDARMNGYPGYRAEITDMRSSVRTILYVSNDRVYLSDEKVFVLSDTWVFTSDPYAVPLLLSSMDHILYLWNDKWANMKTDPPSRNDLIWPLRTWEEVLDYIHRRQFHIHIMRNETDGWKKRWIDTVDSFGGSRFVAAAYRWGNGAATFTLQKRDNSWGLKAVYDTLADAENHISGNKPRKGNYVKSWNYGKSNRWLLTSSIDKALFFNISSIDDGVYRFSYQDRPLTEAGCWTIAFGKLGICKISGVLQGVEFYTNNKPPMDLSIVVVEPDMSDMDRFLLNQDTFVSLHRDQYNVLPPYNIDAIINNLPSNTNACSSTWDGVNMNCYRESNKPYTYNIGKDQCSTLDDMSVDTHCQQWAIANRGNDVDTMMHTLCKDTEPGQYDNVCSCYHRDSVYYDAIVQQRKGDRSIANDVKATNLLQCVSGLCKGGTPSAEMFYHGNRKCDVCIQAARINVQADRIDGDIKIKQACTHVDSTYTWDDLINRLLLLGAYDSSVNRGIHTHVIINNDRSAIKIMNSTDVERDTLNDIPLLSSIGNRDSGSNVIVTRSQWSTNPGKYSNDILLYFLEVIM